MIEYLIIGRPFDYMQLMGLAFLPLLYKLLFWLYSIQLKEYRLDRFMEYLRTKQGKMAVFNIFFIIELCLFLFYCAIWWCVFFPNKYSIAFWGVSYEIMYYYLMMLNIFVVGKIFRKRVLQPKITTRLLVLFILFVVIIMSNIYFFVRLNLWDFTYLYILGLFISMPVMIFVCNAISFPLIVYQKTKQIDGAIKKSKKLNSVITIGITGSYGKSSVKEFLSSILEQDTENSQGERKTFLKTPENKNTEMSVSALVLQKLHTNCKYFVAEMGAYRIGEIHLLGKIVNHKYGFLTAIGNQHIGLFGNQENIIKAKFEIAESVLINGGILYINGDNEYINTYISSGKLAKLEKKKSIITYGISGKNLDAQSQIIDTKNGKTWFYFRYKSIEEKFEIKCIGEHNIVNITGVLACCIDVGLGIQALHRYLENLKSPDNTKIITEIEYTSSDEIDSKQKIVLIDDTYNMSEAGLLSGLNMLSNYFETKQILILDDILELGKEANTIHYNLGKNIATNTNIDTIFFCGANYKESFEKGLIEGGYNKKNIIQKKYENVGDLTPYLNVGEQGRVILFEGKRAGKYLRQLQK